MRVEASELVNMFDIYIKFVNCTVFNKKAIYLLACKPATNMYPCIV